MAAEIEVAVDLPLLHPADPTAIAAQAARDRTVGLLGAAFAMKQDCYRRRLADHGLTVPVPDERDHATVHHVIYDEFAIGTIVAGSRDRYRQVIDRLAGGRAAVVILGYTDILLVIRSGDSALPMFDTTAIHAASAVAAAPDR